MRDATDESVISNVISVVCGLAVIAGITLKVSNSAAKLRFIFDNAKMWERKKPSTFVKGF